MATDIPNIGKKFLEEVDDYLAQNWQNVTCNSIYDAYNQFCNILKEHKGNANGFTGLSEYLIFRFCITYWGGAFKREKHTSETYKFGSQSNRNISIGQNALITIGNKRYYPDVVVFEHDKPLRVIQVKLYLTNGLKTVAAEIEILDNLNRKYSDMRALLLVYVLSSKEVSRLQEIKQHRQTWFDFVTLKGENKLLGKVLQDSLKLGRIQDNIIW